MAKILSWAYRSTVSVYNSQDLCFILLQNPLLTDLVINLSQDGVRLIFDSTSQHLKVSDSLKWTGTRV